MIILTLLSQLVIILHRYKVIKFKNTIVWPVQLESILKVHLRKNFFPIPHRTYQPCHRMHHHTILRFQACSWMRESARSFVIFGLQFY